MTHPGGGGDMDMFLDSDSDGGGSDRALVFRLFFMILCPLVVAALFSNGLAFLVFYKKPIFRKIISNR